MVSRIYCGSDLRLAQREVTKIARARPKPRDARQMRSLPNKTQQMVFHFSTFFPVFVQPTKFLENLEFSSVPLRRRKSKGF